MVWRVGALAGLIILPFVLCSCATIGIEKPGYSVIDKDGKFEIRQYESQIIAETFVDAGFEDAGNVAFRRLFDYISGNNRKKESISMTSPVKQEAESEKIKMTAPVNQEMAGDRYSVSFVMPSKYSLENLPEPTDNKVKIRQIPARKIAVVRYSGTWSEKRYLEKKKELEDFIKRKGLEVIDGDIFARYDPPFHPWFVRRNEVMLPVK